VSQIFLSVNLMYPIHKAAQLVARPFHLASTDGKIIAMVSGTGVKHLRTILRKKLLSSNRRLVYIVFVTDEALNLA
jgi:hypothetical protein